MPSIDIAEKYTTFRLSNSFFRIFMNKTWNYIISCLFINKTLLHRLIAVIIFFYNQELNIWANTCLPSNSAFYALSYFEIVAFLAFYNGKLFHQMPMQILLWQQSVTPCLHLPLIQNELKSSTYTTNQLNNSHAKQIN